MRKDYMIGVLGVVIGVGLVAGEAAAFSASYDQKTIQGRDVFNGRVSLKDDLFRMDTAVGGQTAVIIHNHEGTFTVMPNEGMAMKASSLMPFQRPVSGADDYTQYLARQHAERIGEETVGGYACDIYRLTDPEAGGTITAWVWKDKMFPVRMEIDGAQGKMLVEISNLQLGANIPDSAFKLPDGIQVMDMGSLMGTPQ